MATTLIRGWWVLTLRGIAALLFAVLLLTGTTALVRLAVTVSLYALIDGGCAVVGALCTRGRSHESGVGRGIFFVSGMAGLTVGASGLFFFTRGTLAGLLVAGWALIEGVCALGSGQALARAPSDWLLPHDLARLTRCGFPSHYASSLLVAGGLYVMMGVLLFARVITFVSTPLLPVARNAAEPVLSVALLGLLIAAWGYLHLRTGLLLGIVHWDAVGNGLEDGIGSRRP